MKKQILVVLLVMFFISSVYSITADEVLDNAIEFMGGEKEISKIDSYVLDKYIVSVSTNPDQIPLNQKLYFKKQNKLRVETFKYTALIQYQVYKNNQGWLWYDGDIEEIKEDYQIKEIWLSGFDNLIELKKKKLTLSEDLESYMITYNSKYGIAYKFFFSKLDYSLSKLEFTVENKTIIILFKDYQILEETGIKYSLLREVSVDGKKVLEEHIIKIKFPEELEEELFQKPEQEKDD